MPDHRSAVQSALYSKLSADVTLAPVYSHPPEGAEPPLVIIAEFESEQFGGKADTDEQMTVEIVTFTRGESRVPLFALMAQVKDALDGQAIAQTGFTLSRPVQLSSSDSLLGDGVTYEGRQSFLIFSEKD